MIRLDVLQTLSNALALSGFHEARVAARARRWLIQRCPLAGFAHHDGEDLWSYLTVGDRLELRREPDNKNDPDAIRVDWNGRRLGYIPREQNRTAARLMDRGMRLEAQISTLARDDNPWRRTTVEVWLVE
jgi:hypothetical protein